MKGARAFKIRECYRICFQVASDGTINLRLAKRSQLMNTDDSQFLKAYGTYKNDSFSLMPITKASK